MKRRFACSLFRKKKSTAGFPKAEGSFARYSDWLLEQPDRAALSDHGAKARYFEQLRAFLDNNPGGVVITDQDITQQVLEELSTRNSFGLNVRLPFQTIKFTGKRISNLECPAATLIELDNCIVTYLSVSHRFSQRISLTECQVQTIAFVGNTETLEIVGGRIDAFLFPQPEAQIRGPVTFRRVSLPTDPLQLQPLRTLRGHLMRIHNTDPASLVRAAELRISFPEQQGPVQAFSLMYDLGSNYGNSSVRPALWFFLLVALSVVILQSRHATQLAMEPMGWQTDLIGDGYLPNLYRAVVLTMSQIFNPLGVLGRTPLVVATKLWLVILSGTICLFATAALALFVLALRRSIKLDG